MTGIPAEKTWWRAELVPGLEHYGDIDGCTTILLFAETIDVSRSALGYESGSLQRGTQTQSFIGVLNLTLLGRKTKGT
jgi:hypothetical protein